MPLLYCYHMGHTTLQCVLHDAHVINSQLYRRPHTQALLPEHIKVLNVLSSNVQGSFWVYSETPKWFSIFIDSSLVSIHCILLLYELYMTILGQALQWLRALSGLEAHNIMTIE